MARLYDYATLFHTPTLSLPPWLRIADPIIKCVQALFLHKNYDYEKRQTRRTSAETAGQYLPARHAQPHRRTPRHGQDHPRVPTCNGNPTIDRVFLAQNEMRATAA